MVMSLKELKNHWKTIREELDQLPTNYIQEERIIRYIEYYN